MRTTYTVIEGELIQGESIIKFPFALVFEEDGVFYVETFLKDRKFFDETPHHTFYRLVGKTEKGYDIEIEELAYTKFTYSNCKLDLVCYGHIKLVDNRKGPPDEEEVRSREDSVYVVEVEGLEMQLAHHTSIERYRNEGKVDDFVKIDFDHTGCAMLVNFTEGEGNYYKLVFSKNSAGSGIIIDFTRHEGYNRLTYKNYLTIKHTFMSFLSFMNGCDVMVRKELTGWFITSRGDEYINAQCVYIYSREKLAAASLSDFIPINDHHSYSSQIVPHLFLSCFDSYYQLDKALDFRSLVFSLNNATRTAGLDEKYFILITALEKVCSNHSKTLSTGSRTVVDAELFNEVLKPELDAVLQRHEARIKQSNAKAYNILKSKIGNLNNINKGETAQKLHDFFNYCGILINAEVESLIDTERNQAVHEDVIGQTEEAKIKNYWKLDHILRDAILNLIGYKSYRNYVFEYFK